MKIPNTYKKQELSWALYDWANSAYAVVVITAFFPLFFKQYWAGNLEATESTFYMGLANSIGSLIIAITAPFLGALADAYQCKKRYLIIFIMLGCVSTAGLFLVAQGAWQLALLLYLLSSIGWSSANVFYDAFLVVITQKSKRHWVSSLGFALGYIGGGILFLFCVLLTLFPKVFGLADEVIAVRISFILVAIWWLGFSFPLLFGLGEENSAAQLKTGQFKNALKEVLDTFHEIRRQRIIWLFLLAYWFYIDGVDTIIRMSVDYGAAIGLPTSTLITAVLVVQFVSFPSVLIFGWYAQRYSAISGIFCCLTGFVFVTIGAAFISEVWQFFVLAVGIAFFQGGIQALSRSTFSLYVPEGKSGEYFGFFNLMGKAAAILGPFFVGLMAIISGSHRFSILSVIILFFMGFVFLLFFHREAKRGGAPTKID